MERSSWAEQALDPVAATSETFQTGALARSE
jgi:hypothetical protein